jgi:hypothetical protein
MEARGVASVEIQTQAERIEQRSRTLRPEMMDNDASPQTEPTDRILVSSLRFWEVERDLIEERIGAIGRDRSFVRKRHPDWREFPKSRVEVYDDWIPDRLRNLGNNLSVSCLLTGREHRRTPRRKRKDVRRNCGRDVKGGALFAFEADCRNIYRPFQEFLDSFSRV